MNKVAVFYNQDYLEKPQSYPRQVNRMMKLADELKRRNGHQLVFHPINFRPEKANTVIDHVESQMVDYQRDLTHAKVVAFFGDGGTGLFLSGLDRLARHQPELRENPVCLGPGGTYIHGAKAMGTPAIEDVADFATDRLDYLPQKVKIRNCRVTKTDRETGHVKSVEDAPFFGFAGMFFDAYVLELNEKMGRTGSRLQNAASIIGEAAMDVFSRGKKSRLRAFTTLPRWGFARFDPEVESLDNDGIYMMKSDDAGPVDMVKLGAVINVIASNRLVLKSILKAVDIGKGLGFSAEKMSMMDILDKFRPRRIEKFSEDFSDEMLGGLHYSTDGFPHRIALSKGEQASLEISTIADSGVKVVRKK